MFWLGKFLAVGILALSVLPASAEPEFRWSDFQSRTIATITAARPTKLIINGSDSKMLVEISLEDGSVKFGEHYTADEASRVFWAAMGRKLKECEEAK